MLEGLPYRVMALHGGDLLILAWLSAAAMHRMCLRGQWLAGWLAGWLDIELLQGAAAECTILWPYGLPQ
jgi:hypothetical protein